MATASPVEAAPAPVAAPADLKIYAHSPVLYWWPVWALGFLMALWTVLDDHHLVVVPAGTVVTGNQVIVPDGKSLEAPLVHVARSKVPGTLFVLTFLAVLILNHLWLRGPWALFMAAAVVAAVLLLSWLEWWGPLGRLFRLIRVHINLGGYLLLSTALFVVWALTVFVFDRRTYMVFSVGQVRIRDELGDQERAFDTTAIAFEKRPYDWFRWLVGWGAGDMIVRTGGPHAQVFELPNVVRVGKWLEVMERQLRTRDVV
jgi:hypothetical protein